MNDLKSKGVLLSIEHKNTIQCKHTVDLLTLLEEQGAEDIVFIYSDNPRTVTEMLIIATGQSLRHNKALGLKTLELLKPAFKCNHSGLSDDGNWVLIAFGNAMLHIMTNESREYYNLEQLWSKQDSIESAETLPQQD